jgi:hypothetical protein
MTTIHVVMELEVDEGAWQDEFSCASDQVTNDVENYLLNLVQGSSAAHTFTVTGYAVREGQAFLG